MLNMRTHSQKTSHKTNSERRKHWQDRRSFLDRRNPERLSHSSYDCRSGAPRRQSDLAGELAEGDIWWNSNPF
jgi:hypothetical protein